MAFAGLSRRPAEDQVERTAPGWVDVTAELRSSAQSLLPGEVLFSPGFTLFDSMSAVELMSPKMDAGMSVHRHTPIEERLHTGSLPVPPASAHEVIAVIDRLLAMELAWYDGHSLAQTIFSCLYFHPSVEAELLSCAAPLLPPGAVGGAEARGAAEPDRALLALVLHATCSATRFTAYHLRELVMTVDLYEEEDFSPYDAGLEQHSKIALGELTELLEHTEALLRRRSRDDAGGAFGLTREGCDGLAMRLRLRRLYAQAYALLDEKLLKGFDKAKVALEACAALAAEIVRSCTEEAAPPPPQSAVALAFDAIGCSSQLAPAPPRPLPPPPPPRETYAALRRAVWDLRVLCDVAKRTTLHGLFIFILHFGQRAPNIMARSRLVSTLYSTEHLVLGRWTYDTLLRRSLADFGVDPATLASPEGKQFIERAVKPMYDALRLLASNRSRLRRKLVHLFEASARHHTVTDLALRPALSCCDWAALQSEGDFLDERVYFAQRGGEQAAAAAAASATAAQGGGKTLSLEEAYPGLHHCLGGWALEWSLRLMCLHLLLGFELELYAPPEVDSALWYLDYLLSNAQQNRQLMERHVAARTKAKEACAAVAAAAAGAGGGGSGKRKGGKKKRGGKGGGGGASSSSSSSGAAAERPTRSPLVAREQPVPLSPRSGCAFGYMLELRKQLARGVRHGIVSLRANATSPEGSAGGPPGGAEEAGPAALEPALHSEPFIRFAHRFAPYAAFSQPPALAYSDFESATRPNARYHHDDLRAVAQECFSNAKMMVQQLLRITEGSALVDVPILPPCTGKAGKKTTRDGSAVDEVARVDVLVAELKSLVRVAVANSVALMKLQRSSGGDVSQCIWSTP